jgi:formylglycine-generating enzyme required for sulfatase activity
MNARCAIRDHNKPDERFDDIGFRVARDAPEATNAPLPRGLK